MHMDVGFRNFQGLRVLAGESGNVLRGDVGEEMIIVCPLSDGAVAFQAAMRDYRTAIHAFRNNFGFLKGRVRIAFDLPRLFLIRRIVGLGLFHGSRLNRFDYFIAHFIVFQPFFQFGRHLEGQTTFLHGGNHLVVWRVVVKHLSNIALGKRASALRHILRF